MASSPKQVGESARHNLHYRCSRRGQTSDNNTNNGDEEAVKASGFCDISSPFHSLERLLPASLWSRSFMQERLDYILTSRHHHGDKNAAAASSKPNSSPQPSPPLSLGLSTNFLSPSATSISASSAARVREQTISGEAPSQTSRSESIDVQRQLPAPFLPPSSLRWSLVGMQRAFLRARRMKEGGLPLPTFPNAVATDAADKAARERTRSCHERDGKKEEEYSLVLVASSDDEAPMDAEGRTTHYAEDTPFRRQCKRSRTAFSSEPPLPRAPVEHRVSTENNAPQEERRVAAVAVLSSLVASIEQRHRSRCPLCGPKQAPAWFTHGSTKNRVYGSSDGNCNEDECTQIIPDAPAASSTAKEKDAAPPRGPASQEAKIKALQRDAEAFLQHHRERERHLISTKPRMYVQSEEHVLLARCKALGGIALLEALLIGI